MIASVPGQRPRRDGSQTADVSWHPQFLKMLPRIERHARIVFRHLSPGDREERIQEVIAHTVVAYARLVEQGRPTSASWSSLARFAIRHVRAGRCTGTPLNVRDVCSVYCQRRKGVRVERLERYDEQQGWRELLVEDRTCSPSELAASRIDFAAFLDGLSQRNREIAAALGSGESTSDVARMFHLSKARVSQLRRELYQAWLRFLGEELQPEPARA